MDERVMPYERSTTSMDRTGGYVHSGDDTVERECDHCEWDAVAESYPTLIKRYQNHLRENHPMVWMRS